MMAYETPINWHDVFELLDKIVVRGEMPGPVASFIMDRGVASIQRNFRAGGRVGGSTGTWDDLAESTKAQRREGKKTGRLGHRVLIDTGELMRSFEVQHSDSNTGIRLGRDESVVRIGTTKDYARTHQEGAPARKIPARPFAMWQSRDIDLIAKALADYLVGKGI